jgi:anti-sigma B factor antagonist
MVLKHRTVNDIDVVDLAGRLVMGDAPEVREQLKRIIAKGNGKLVLNLAGVSFMDSSGLSVLVSAFKAVQVGEEAWYCWPPHRRFSR